MGFSPPPAGLISGKYRVVGALGHGGMGSVYEAINDKIGRRVALKVIDASLLDNPEYIKRFELEARAAAMIGHPGIVDVLDMGRTNEGAPYFVMEYLDGLTVRALLKGVGTFNAGEASAIVCPVLEALSAAHAADIVHRDLKPANIFVAVRPVAAVKVLDFGVSRFRTAGPRMTAAGTMLGTPTFMAPEQMMDGAEAGPTSDLYSVGAVLFFLLTGRPPFVGGTGNELEARVLTQPPPSLETVRPGLPAGLYRLVEQLLQKRPDQRPSSARQALELLRAAAPPTPEDLFARTAQVMTGAPPERRTIIDAQVERDLTPPTHEGATIAPRPKSRVTLLALLALGIVSLFATLGFLATRPRAEAPTAAPTASPATTAPSAPVLEPLPVQATPAEPPQERAPEPAPGVEVKAPPEPPKPGPPRPKPQKKKELQLDKSNPYL